MLTAFNTPSTGQILGTTHRTLWISFILWRDKSIIIFLRIWWQRATSRGLRTFKGRFHRCSSVEILTLISNKRSINHRAAWFQVFQEFKHIRARTKAWIWSSQGFWCIEIWIQARAIYNRSTLRGNNWTYLFKTYIHTWLLMRTLRHPVMRDKN